MSARTGTPPELAPQLVVTPLQLRNWLRMTYPLRAHERYPRLLLDDSMVRRATDHFRSLESRAEAEHSTTSAVIREALRRFLDVA